jgi:hypothetical protein
MTDEDGDGYGTTAPNTGVTAGTDCADDDDTVHPDAEETWYDAVDQDCDEASDYDADGDGYDHADLDGTDCDDHDATISPDEADTCNDFVDNDCDEQAAECRLDGTHLFDDADLYLTGPEGETSRAGYSLGAAGDFNGDGQDDLIVGAPGIERCILVEVTDTGDTGAPTLFAEECDAVGGAYLVLGPVTSDLSLSASDATFVGSQVDADLGSSVSGAGDVDADGYTDVLLGAPGTGDGGATYLFSGPLTGQVELTEATAVLSGLDGDSSGYHISTAGDLDADGYDDILVGAPNGEDQMGLTYILSGPVTGEIDLDSDVDAKLVGVSDGGMAGVSVAGAGDVDGDGIDDVVIGAHAESTYTGAAYLVHGPISGKLFLDHADAALVGASTYDYAGVSVAPAGDVNADGYADVVVGAKGAKSSVTSSSLGGAYLVLGPVTADIGLGEAHAVFTGSSTDDYAGTSVGSTDADGDGFADLLVGAPGASLGGRAYLVHGPVTGDISLGDADAVFQDNYSSSHETGTTVLGGIDLDGAGYEDFLVGAPGYASGSERGMVYVLYGSGM